MNKQGLVKKVIVNKLGHRQKVWVKIDSKPTSQLSPSEKHKVVSKILNDKVDKTSDKLNSFPKQKDGSNSEKTRNSKEYKQARDEYGKAFSELQRYNATVPNDVKRRASQERRKTKTEPTIKEQKYDFPVYYPSGKITEDFKRHLLSTLYDQGFRRFTRLVRKHINPHYSDDMLRAGAGHTMTFKELASYHLSDADPVLYGDSMEGTDDHKFKELSKEVGVHLPKPNKANSYLK